ncbi:MAG: hypothetical protein ACOYNP_16885 [Gemmataceae bacterium]
MSKGAAGAAAAIAQTLAICGVGMMVRVEPHDFAVFLEKQGGGLVVRCDKKGWFCIKYRYMAPYRGVVLVTEAATPLIIPSDVEVIQAKTIWVPGLGD